MRKFLDDYLWVILSMIIIAIALICYYYDMKEAMVN